MCVTAINQALREDWEKRNKTLTQEAHMRYSPERFNELFSYVKSGKRMVKTEDGSIARTYVQLLSDGIVE